MSSVEMISDLSCDAQENGLGSVIVHDCLKLITTLLSDNVPSCRVFCETGCLERLAPFLQLPSFHKKEHNCATM